MRLQFNAVDSENNTVTHTCDSGDKIHLCSGITGTPCRGNVLASALHVGQHICPNRKGNPHRCYEIQSIVEIGE
jgi:hypothetical protein